MRGLIKLFEEWDQERYGLDEPLTFSVVVDEETVRRIESVRRKAEQKARRRAAKRIMSSSDYFNMKRHGYARRHLQK